MDDQMVFPVFQTLSALISLISIVLLGFGTVMVFSSRWPSSGKNLIGFGLVIHLFFEIAGFVMQFVQKVYHGMGNTALLGFYALSHFATVIATAMIIFGALQLLRRNSLLEQIQQEDDDDR